MGGAGAPQSGVWGPSTTDAAPSMYASNAGGSSVPTGFRCHGPWRPGGWTGLIRRSRHASMQSQPFNSQMPTTSYAGRVLFVGNLPFHCQWQDLKDLFRAAGNIQRADVAIGPDGRSRGFGTVLFTSQEDAQMRCACITATSTAGRTLKVHFDRFAAQMDPLWARLATPAQYTGAFAAAALPSHMTNNVRAPPLAPQPQQQGMQAAFGQQQQYTHQGVQQQQQQTGSARKTTSRCKKTAAAAATSRIVRTGGFQPQHLAAFQYSSQFQPSVQVRQQVPHRSTSSSTATAPKIRSAHQQSQQMALGRLCICRCWEVFAGALLPFVVSPHSEFQVALHQIAALPPRVRSSVCSIERGHGRRG